MKLRIESKLNDGLRDAPPVEVDEKDGWQAMHDAVRAEVDDLHAVGSTVTVTVIA